MIFAAAGLWLAGCSTANQNSASGVPGSDITGSIDSPSGDTPVEQRLLGTDPNDDLSLGKKHFRNNNFGLAEQHFRRAVELHPQDAEAWMGLAASYDRLRRFDLADRAYEQATRIAGPTVEILNNQGFSYMLRGDYRRALKTLKVAEAKDPGNKFVQNNLRLLAESSKKGKGFD